MRHSIYVPVVVNDGALMVRFVVSSEISESKVRDEIWMQRVLAAGGGYRNEWEYIAETMNRVAKALRGTFDFIEVSTACDFRNINPAIVCA